MSSRVKNAGRAALLLACAGTLGAAGGARAFDPESTLERFRDYAMGGSYHGFWYPLRDAAGTEVWYRVNSKWQQPRDEGTTPHQGVDLGSGVGTRVYPVYNGWIVYQSGRRSDGTCCFTDASGQTLWEMILQLDVNDDGIQNDAVYHKYDHLERVGYRSTGVYVSTADMVATSGNENGQYTGAHLHFGNLNPRSGQTGRWTGMERHYGWSADYNYGDDLDFISYVTKDAYNVVQATTYVMSSGTRTSITAGNVRLFHRRAGTSAWSNAAMTLTATADRWQIDLDGLGYGPGVSIQYFVRSSRAGLVEPHNSAFFPAIFAHAINDPNATAALYPYYTAVTQ